MTNMPYIPSDGLINSFRRRFTRLQARKPLDCAQGRFLVSFTFDDFPRSAAINGAKILEKYGWRGTYYTSAAFVGTTNHLGDLFKPEDISKLVSQGHEIACHTEHHIDCALNAPVVIEREIRRNQARLRTLGAPKPVSFAYPYGEISASAKTLLGSHYQTLRGVRAGINRRYSDAHQLNAVPVEGGLDAKALAISYVEKLNEAPGWLIFYAHDVRDAPGEWGCTPALLDAVCAVVKNAGHEVLPVCDAMSALTGLEEAA